MGGGGGGRRDGEVWEGKDDDVEENVGGTTPCSDDVVGNVPWSTQTSQSDVI